MSVIERGSASVAAYGLVVVGTIGLYAGQAWLAMVSA